MSNLYYAWTNNKGVPSSSAKHFIEYLDVNRAYLIPIGNYVFDSISLREKISLSKCLECKKIQKEDCCNGNSLPMPKDNADNLRSVSRSILESIPDNAYVMSYFNSFGALTRNNATTTKGNTDGNCIFSCKTGGCYIHKWCLSEGKNPYKYKPYPCSLFPLQGIVMPNGRIVVFNSTKSTSCFSMFFYTLTRRICVNEENLMKAYSGQTGGNKYLKDIDVDNLKKCDILGSMRPAYIEQEGILRFLCGDNVYDELLKNITKI